MRTWRCAGRPTQPPRPSPWRMRCFCHSPRATFRSDAQSANEQTRINALQVISVVVLLNLMERFRSLLHRPAVNDSLNGERRGQITVTLHASYKWSHHYEQFHSIVSCKNGVR